MKSAGIFGAALGQKNQQQQHNHKPNVVNKPKIDEEYENDQRLVIQSLQEQIASKMKEIE